jgi:hypothetical protein
MHSDSCSACFSSSRLHYNCHTDSVKFSSSLVSLEFGCQNERSTQVSTRYHKSPAAQRFALPSVVLPGSCYNTRELSNLDVLLRHHLASNQAYSSRPHDRPAERHKGNIRSSNTLNNTGLVRNAVRGIGKDRFLNIRTPHQSKFHARHNPHQSTDRKQSATLRSRCHCVGKCESNSHQLVALRCRHRCTSRLKKGAALHSG